MFRVTNTDRRGPYRPRDGVQNVLTYQGNSGVGRNGTGPCDDKAFLTERRWWGIPSLQVSKHLTRRSIVEEQPYGYDKQHQTEQHNRLSFIV